MNKIKIAQVCAIDFTVEKLLLPLIMKLEENYKVDVVCSPFESNNNLLNLGLNIKQINIDRKINLISNLKSIINLYKLFKKEKYHIVHCHTPIASVLGRIAAKIAGIPIIIYTAHGFYFHENMSVVKKIFFLFIEKIMGKLFTDYIFTQSEEDYYTAINNKIIDRTKIKCIGNGIDIKKFEKKLYQDQTNIKRKELEISETDIVISIVARMVEEKGYIELIEAAKYIARKYSNCKFILIGEGDIKLYNYLLKKVKDYDIEKNVIFLGARSDIPELLAISDIFVLPSYREGMPRSIIEAMSMELPVIATNIRGCREEVEDETTGFLVPVKDPESLQNKIIELIGNPELCKKMGVKARNKVIKQYDERQIIQRQLDTLQELINKKVFR